MLNNLSPRTMLTTQGRGPNPYTSQSIKDVTPGDSSSLKAMLNGLKRGVMTEI